MIVSHALRWLRAIDRNYAIVCNFDPLMEWAPRADRDQAADLTVGRAWGDLELLRAQIAEG